MADDNNTISGLPGLDPALTNVPKPQQRANNEVGKNEFLQLLVTQLKHQDPLDPMKNEEFAVQLAQFSQLEQLMSINDKIGQTSGPDLTSMAAYLGHEVTLNSPVAEFHNGDGGLIKVDLPQDVTGMRIDIMDESGSITDSIDVGELSAGKHTLSMTGPASTNGKFTLRVTATGAQGESLVIPAAIAGIVTGFVPGPEPMLLLGSREIRPSDVVEVGLPTVA